MMPEGLLQTFRFATAPFGKDAPCLANSAKNLRIKADRVSFDEKSVWNKRAAIPATGMIWGLGDTPTSDFGF
jgi:hypothetical protein